MGDGVFADVLRYRWVVCVVQKWAWRAGAFSLVRGLPVRPEPAGDTSQRPKNDRGALALAFSLVRRLEMTLGSRPHSSPKGIETG